MNSYVIITIFQVLAFVLIFLEILIPSGGVISILAIGGFAYSWFIIVEQAHTTSFLLFGLLDLIGIPLSIIIGFKVLKASPLMNNEDLTKESGYTFDTSSSHEDLIGKTGLVITQLRPSGTIEIEGEQFDALSNGEMIEPDLEVLILDVSENKIIVALKNN
ncbi:MAG: hypothetical protein OCC49_04510 [Fibrobacterales bacterium]